MKAITTLVAYFCFAILFSHAQEPMFFSEVVKVDSSLSKEVLFSRARAWFSSHYLNSKAALDVQDKETGELLGNGSIDVNALQIGSEPFPYGLVTYNFKIFVKDGRYKYEFSNFVHKNKDDWSHGYISYGPLNNSKTAPNGIKCPMCGEKLNNKCWNSIIDDVKSKMDLHITSLKSSMLKDVSGSKEEW